MSARSTLRQGAYVAVGMPAVVIRRLSERISKVRDSMQSLGDRLTDDAEREFDRWVTEGEQLVSRMRRRREEARRHGVAADRMSQVIEEGAAIARETVEGLGRTLTEPMVAVDRIPGIGPAYAAKLAAAGVTTTAALLERGRTAASRRRLSSQTGISPTVLETWVASADLGRVAGIGDEYRALLNAAEVASVEDLAESDPVRLAESMTRLNAETGLVEQVPSKRTVAGWIAEAKRLAA